MASGEFIFICGIVLNAAELDPTNTYGHSFSPGGWPDGRSERGEEATGRRVLPRIQIYLIDQELEVNRDEWQGEIQHLMTRC